MGANAEIDRFDPLFRAATTGDKDTIQRLLPDHNIDEYDTDICGRTALMIAAGKGYADCIKCFVDANKTADINMQDIYGNTALMLASRRGNFECVRHLLDTGSIDINLRSESGSTALMIAVDSGYDEIVKTLAGIEGINVNISDNLYGRTRTALMLASLGRHTECAKILIDTRLTDVNFCGEDGNTALMIAAEKGYYEIVEILTGVEGIDVDISDKQYGRTALMLALRGGHKECVKCLIDTGLTDVNLCDKFENTALMIAARNGYNEIVKTLLEVEGIAVDFRGRGRTALMIASLKGHLGCAKCLIDMGCADVNLCAKNRYTALMKAAERGHYDIVKTLLGIEGIAVNISDTRCERTALMLALQGGHKECVKCLIDSRLADVNLCDKDGYTALMSAAEKRYYEIVELLTRVEGIAVDVSDKQYERTALMLASERGHKECVKCLIDTGLTDVNLCDKDGYTALMIAAQTGHYIEILTRAEEIAVNICDKRFGRTALMLAANEGNVQCVTCLLERETILINFQDNDKSTALMLASDHVYGEILYSWDIKRIVHFGHIQCVEALISSKAEVNIQDNNGQTALMRASSKGNIKCVKALINCKAEVNILDNNGQTALMCASSKGHAQCVGVLLSSKAEVNIRDNNGQTSLMLAVLNRQLDCVKRFIGDTNVNVWERDNQGKTAFMFAVEIPDVKYLQCFFDITTAELGNGGREVHQNDEPGVRIICISRSTSSRPYINECDRSEEFVVMDGLGLCLTCFLLAYTDVPLTENCPCSHSLLDNTEACDYDEDVETALMITSRQGNRECLEYLLQFQRIRIHLLVMLLQKEFLVFGTISIIFYKRLCSLVRDHNNIDQFLYMMCNGDEIRKCVDYLLSAVICQMNSSGNNAISYALNLWSTSRSLVSLKLLLQHVSDKNHLLVHMEKFYPDNPMTNLNLDLVLELVKAGVFLWKWYPVFHGFEKSINIHTRELVVRDFAPGLFEWQGKQSSLLYYAFMSRNHGLVRYLMVNLYLTPRDLELFQGDTRERECLLQIRSENIQQIYQEHFRAPWSLERLSLLSLSNWLRKNKEQKDVDKVLDKLPEMFRSRLSFRNPMRMICRWHWKKINLDFLNHRLSASLNYDNLFHVECCNGVCLRFETFDSYSSDSDSDSDYHHYFEDYSSDNDDDGFSLLYY